MAHPKGFLKFLHNGNYYWKTPLQIGTKESEIRVAVFGQSAIKVSLFELIFAFGKEGEEN